MALTSAGFELSVTLIDSGENTSTLRYSLQDGTGGPPVDAAAAATAAAAIMTDLQAVTNAVVKSYAVTERFIEDALTLPGAGVHVEDRATVTLQLASSPLKRAVVNIPAPVIGVFQGTTGEASNVVDPTDVDLRAYVANFNDGGAGTATISDGEMVDATAANTGIVRGVRTHRRSSRG